MVSLPSSQSRTISYCGRLPSTSVRIASICDGKMLAPLKKMRLSRRLSTRLMRAKVRPQGHGSAVTEATSPVR